ncbi:MAG: right-handed parallel beta-helix repeat-containing protein [Halanaerobiales bacterium]
MKKNRIFRITLLLIIVLTLSSCNFNDITDPGDPVNPPPDIPVGPVYFVDQSIGNDENPGTEEEPWATVQHAVDMAEAGDTIFIKPGEYGEVGAPINFYSGTTGAEDAWITIEGYPHNEAVIAGGVDTRGSAWKSPGGGWVRFKGLTLKSGIHIHNSQNAPVEIIDNVFDFSTSKSGVAIAGSNNINVENLENVVIKNNYVYGAQYGIITGGKARNWLVENNIIERIIKHGDGDADFIRVFGSGHIFRGNILFGTRSEEKGSAHTDGFQTFAGGARNILIESNIISGFDQGIMVSTTDGAINENWTVRNNIFSGTYADGEPGGSFGIAIHQNSGTARGWTIVNNIFANNRYHGVALRENSSYMTVKNNLFYNSNMYTGFDKSREDMFVGYNMCNRESSSLSTDITGVDLSLVFKDPVEAYINPLNYPDRFALRAGTTENPNPAVDAGEDLSDLFNTDIRGVSRPQGSGWDIGPYELEQ